MQIQISADVVFKSDVEKQAEALAAFALGSDDSLPLPPPVVKERDWDAELDSILDKAKENDFHPLIELLKNGGEGSRRIIRHQHTKYRVSALMLAAGMNKVDCTLI